VQSVRTLWNLRRASKRLSYSRVRLFVVEIIARNALQTRNDRQQMTNMGETNVQNGVASLRNGVQLPQLGLGVWQAPRDDVTRRAVRSALQPGYPQIDAARSYGNEQDVGAAVRESGIPREQIFVTTELWNDDQGYEQTLRAFAAKHGAARPRVSRLVAVALASRGQTPGVRVRIGVTPRARTRPIDRGQ
jgi:hypothetical protein